MPDGITATMDAQLLAENVKLQEENTSLRAICLLLRMNNAVMQEDANLGKAVRCMPEGYHLVHDTTDFWSCSRYVKGGTFARMHHSPDDAVGAIGP